MLRTDEFLNKFDKLMPNCILVEEYVLITHFYSFIGHDMIYNQLCQYSQG